MNLALSAAAFVLYCVVAVLLVRRYRGTGNAGFLWLGLPLVLSPVAALPLALWLQLGVDRLELGQQVNSFPFTLVEEGRISLGDLLTLVNLIEHVIWGAVSLVAVVALNVSRKTRKSSRRDDL